MAAPVCLAGPRTIPLKNALYSCNRCRKIFISTFLNSRYSTVAVNQEVKDKPVEKIVIPKKKRRDSLSILKALSETVGQDETASHYLYIDDPVLLPNNLFNKKMYAMSKASGRKAAKYILNQHPEYLKAYTSVPEIKAFSPPTEYQNNDDSDNSLEERISLRRVNDAVAVYRRMKDGGVEVSPETHLRLLELACFYNGKDPPEIEEPEDVYFENLLTTKEEDYAVKMKSTWRVNGIPDEIFNDMVDASPAAYNSMIRAMAQCKDFDEAYRFYQGMKANKIEVSLESYHALLRTVYVIPDTFDARWETAENILRDMRDSSVQPNVDTFLAVFDSLMRFGRHNNLRNIVRSLLSEMKHLHLEPSLGVYASVIHAMFREGNGDGILYEIVDYLKGKELTYHSDQDGKFFVNAMKKCFHNLNDLDLCYKINDLLNTGSNFVFIGDGSDEHKYYEHFFRCLCMFETADKLMEHFHSLVPQKYSPGTLLLQNILDVIQLYEGHEHLPSVWSYMAMSQSLKFERLMEKMFGLMAAKENGEELQQKLINIVEYAFTEYKACLERNQKDVQLTGQSLGDMITICCYGNDLKLAWSLFEFYAVRSNFIDKQPSEESMEILLNACIGEQNAEKAIKCLSIMANVGIDVNAFVDKVKTLDLTDNERMGIENVLKIEN